MTKILPPKVNYYSNAEWRIAAGLGLWGSFEPWPLILKADLAEIEPMRPGVSAWAIHFARDPHLSPLLFSQALRAALLEFNVEPVIDLVASLRAALETHAHYVEREFEATKWQ